MPAASCYCFKQKTMNHFKQRLQHITQIITASGCSKTLQTGSYKIANTSIKSNCFKNTSSSKHCFFNQFLSNHYTSLQIYSKCFTYTSSSAASHSLMLFSFHSHNSLSYFSSYSFCVKSPSLSKSISNLSGFKHFDCNP